MILKFCVRTVLGRKEAIMRIRDDVGEALYMFDGSQLLLRYGYDE